MLAKPHAVCVSHLNPKAKRQSFVDVCRVTLHLNKFTSREFYDAHKIIYISNSNTRHPYFGLGTMYIQASEEQVCTRDPCTFIHKASLYYTVCM